MSPSKRSQIAFIMLAVASMACIVPSISTPAPPDAGLPGALNTSIAQTVIAELTVGTPIASPQIDASATFTFTPEVPTVTPTVSLTPTITLTPTPLIPLISVSVATNCRNGPGKVYDRVGALLVGETAEVFGRDPGSNYWYIRNPKGSPAFCWVWGNYATLTGPFLLLPILTPPPTPTPTFTPLPTFTATPSPSFKSDYISKDSCSGAWWPEIKLRNNGTIAFRSIFISVKDTVTGVTNAQINDGFTDRNGCLETLTRDKISAGDTYLLSAPAFNYDPAGHLMETAITLCSDTGQKGLCATRRFEFIP